MKPKEKGSSVTKFATALKNGGKLFSDQDEETKDTSNKLPKGATGGLSYGT
jgi:hypothetical protein